MLNLTGRGLSFATQSEILGAGTGKGVDLTSGGTNHTYGTLTTIGTSTFEYNEILISGELVTNSRYFITVTAGVSDIVVVDNMFIEPTSGSQPYSILLPVRIASGSVVKMKIAAANANSTANFGITGFGMSPGANRGVLKVYDFGDYTTSLPTSSITLTGTSFSSYCQIVASTPAYASTIVFMPSRAGDASRTTSFYRVALATGAAASEVVFSEFIMGSGTGSFTQSQSLYRIPCNISAGTRLSFKVQTDQAGTTDSAMSMGAIGYGT